MKSDYRPHHLRQYLGRPRQKSQLVWIFNYLWAAAMAILSSYYLLQKGNLIWMKLLGLLTVLTFWVAILGAALSSRDLVKRYRERRRAMREFREAYAKKNPNPMYLPDGTFNLEWKPDTQSHGDPNFSVKYRRGETSRHISPGGSSPESSPT